MISYLRLQPVTSLSCRLLRLLLLLTASIASHAANYVIDTSNTNVRFAIDNLKSAATTGGFYNVQGQLKYDPYAKTGNISLVIPIKSLDTGNKAFNIKLTDADFFNMQQFPSARFESTKWYFNNAFNEHVTKVDGNLTLRGETHPISLQATKFNCYLSSSIKKDVCSGNFTTTIDRTRWNINKYTLFGTTKNLTLNIQVAATKH